MRRAALLATIAVLAARAAGATTAADLCPAAADPCEVIVATTVTPGSVLDFGARALLVRATGKLVVSNGPLTIRAGAVRLEPKGEILGLGGDVGSNITIQTTGDIRIEGAGSTNARLDVSAALSPGQVDMVAGGDIVVSGFLNANGLTNDGGGGVLNMTAAGDVILSGSVKLKGGDFNLGGFLTVSADEVSISGLVDASAADGGILDFDARTLNLASAGKLVLKGGGGFGDGGELDIFARGDIVLAGEITAQGAGSYTSGGGAGASILIISDEGSITISGSPLYFNGAPPDGEGGELDMTAALDITQTATLYAHGNGIDTCGGTLLASAGRRLSLSSTIRVDGGSCGAGFIIADAGELASINATVDGTGSGAGAAVAISAGRISVAGKVNSSGTVTGAPGGLNQLTACQIDLLAGSLLQANGTAGTNRIQASGALTVAGSVFATPTGANILEYRDPLLPPVILGAATMSPVAAIVPNPGLPACPASGAVCGNGTLESGEECDDTNTDACDGCSPSCRDEGCGNHRIECDEECDNGPANGTPGNACSAICEAVDTPGVLLKPGKRFGPAACFLEWALRNPGGAESDGFPETKQVCVDGDPGCDADDANNGTCVFRAAACLAPVDARLPNCQPLAIASAHMRKPNPVAPRNAVDAANAQVLADALAGLGITVTFKDTTLHAGVPNPTRGACSSDFDILVPHPAGTIGTRLLKAGATDIGGRRLRANRLALVCAPNTAVCGNGAVEVGETCDDGNTAGCDGCNDRCRVEACGNGRVDCGEDCDDGAGNGLPGGTCTATCTEAPPALRIPGGRRSTECLSEWSMKIGTPALLKTGLPHIKQSCADNDPTCDFDPTPGTCRFHVWLCTGGDDARIACTGSGVDQVDVIRPKPTQTGFAGPARAALVAALDRLALPGGPGEQCSGRAALDVPAGRARLVLRAGALGAAGTVDRDTLKLSCVP